MCRQQDWVYEMDEVQDDMPQVDTCLVVGANDITNEAAETEEDLLSGQSSTMKTRCF